MKDSEANPTMRPLKLTLLTLTLAIQSLAQTAKVIQLSPQDAAEAKQVYEAQVAANKRVEEFRAKIDAKYLTKQEPGSDPPTFLAGRICSIGGNCAPPETPAEKKARIAADELDKRTHAHPVHLEGWSMFEFSDDFKFIVPKSTFTTNPNSLQPCGAGVYLGNCYIAN
jgi:hypothetical protein